MCPPTDTRLPSPPHLAPAHSHVPRPVPSPPFALQVGLVRTQRAGETTARLYRAAEAGDQGIMRALLEGGFGAFCLCCTPPLHPLLLYCCLLLLAASFPPCLGTRPLFFRFSWALPPPRARLHFPSG